VSFATITFVLLLNECLMLFISLSTQSGNVWIHTHICWYKQSVYQAKLIFVSLVPHIMEIRLCCSLNEVNIPLMLFPSHTSQFHGPLTRGIVPILAVLSFGQFIETILNDNLCHVTSCTIIYSWFSNVNRSY